MPSSFLRRDCRALRSNSALPEIRKRIDGAERILKADIAWMKKLLADRTATLPPSIAEVPLQQAKNTLDLLAVYSQQLTRWHEDAIADADRVEVVRLRAIIPEIRPLIQRFIALATELDKRAKSGAVSPTQKVALLSVDKAWPSSIANVFASRPIASRSIVVSSISRSRRKLLPVAIAIP
jgi:hypothetical protein